MIRSTNSAAMSFFRQRMRVENQTDAAVQNGSAHAEVVANVEGSDGAIVRFNEWQTTALGRDINPDKLRSLILSPRWAEGLEGAIRVDVVKPEHTAVADTEVAAFSGRLTVSHKSVTGVV